MTPSFFCLFRRGHYFRPPDEDDHSEGARTQREERERFAVATLAFCLKHDAPFRQRFMEKICRVPSDPQKLPLVTADGIEIEPYHWADLRITSACERYRWIIEAKAGARLQEKQNPVAAAFTKPGEGYGALFRADEKDYRRKLRYIVLGINTPLKLKDGGKRSGIAIQERPWNAILDGISKTGIVKDLIDTFAELHIGDSYMEKAKRIKLGEGVIPDAVKAATVLRAVCDYLGAGDNKFHMQAEAYEDGYGCLGYWIKQPSSNASVKYKKLKQATMSEGWSLGWYGYEYDAQGVTKRVVYLYFASITKRDNMQKKLKKKLNKLCAVADATMDGDTLCVHVTGPLKQSVNEFEWFQSVIDFAIS